MSGQNSPSNANQRNVDVLPQKERKTDLRNEIGRRNFHNSLEIENGNFTLWQNPEFFITLPLKKNEDINLTKASHIRMNPYHYVLALKKVDQLPNENLIEPTTSPWACEAFYVNKRAEQVRGKLRLVINYQPLNHFLTDDKFPLPKREVLFKKFPQAKIL